MPYRGDAFVAGQYYHVYNRGAGGHRIFFNEGNYRYLLRLAARHRRTYGITVIAYCLMPNHYHFLLRQETDEPLSRFINVLFSAYVQALNRQQGRTGTLFQGRFHHKRVTEWGYILQLCRYIHMNPVRAKLASHPETWEYSDYIEWIGSKVSELGDACFVRDHFPDPQEYRAFVVDAQDEARNREKLTNYVWD